MARTLWLGEDPDGVTTAPPAAPRLVVSVYAGPQRAGQYRRYQLPHESVGWPERDLAPGQTLGQYVADHRRGVRRFTLWRDRDRGEALARVTTRTAAEDRVEYEVRDADGTPLAVVAREAGAARRLRRTRWTVRQLDQADRPAAVGTQGGVGGWCLWLLCSPLNLLLAVVTLGNFVGVRTPRRLRLRSGGRVVLDYRGVSRNLEVLSDGWDPRVVACLVVLVERATARLIEQTTNPSYV